MPPLKPGHISPTPEEDAEIDAAIASDPDTREVTGELRPAMEDPFIRRLVERIEEEREARKAVGKTRVTIRLDADVVSRLREDGPGGRRGRTRRSGRPCSGRDGESGALCGKG